MDRTRNAASFVRKMGEPTGRKCCFTTKTPARLIWRSSREIPRQFSPHCGKRAVRRGAFILRRMALEADFIVPTMAGTIGRPSRADCRQKASDGWELRLRPAIQSGFISSSMPRRADCTARMTVDRTGSKFPKTTGFGAAAGTSTKSPLIQRTPTLCMCRILPSTAPWTEERVSRCSRAIRPAPITTSCGLIQMIQDVWS